MSENTSLSPSVTTTMVNNATENCEDISQIGKSWDDATWILTSSFIIFTMQSGFGLLESGSVSEKNEVNIMAKNVADVVFGGISYWMLGYGFSFGDGSGTNGFCGYGKFFVDPDDDNMGDEFSQFVFQSSFATTATTIVSGAVAERTKYVAYIVFSFFNTFVFCFPAHWIWAKSGWLNTMGVVDVAGGGPVHLVGGVTALVGAMYVKPRARRFTPHDDHEMGSPTSALLGLFILWWGWLAFNCGSTYGISNNKWKMAARAAATTLMAASMAGVVGFFASYIVNKKKFSITYIINSILAGLVSITAICAVTGMWESLVIGGLGAVICLLADAAMNRLKVDDPVSAFAIHGVGGAWGLFACGIFGHKDEVANFLADRGGLIETGGNFHLLGIQILAIVSIAAWSAISSCILFFLIDKTIGMRMSEEDEEIGADFCEHGIKKVRFQGMVYDEQTDDNENNNTTHETFQTEEPDVLRQEVGDGVISPVANGNGRYDPPNSPHQMETTGKDIIVASRCFRFWKLSRRKGNDSVRSQRIVVREAGNPAVGSRRGSTIVYPVNDRRDSQTLPNISSNVRMLSYSNPHGYIGNRVK